MMQHCGEEPPDVVLVPVSWTSRVVGVSAARHLGLSVESAGM
jgi:hypothetical protein